MEIQAIKTWQWMLAGLVVGLLFSCIVAWSGPAFDTQARDTMEQGEFENDTVALTRFGQISAMIRRFHEDPPEHHDDEPVLKDVTVHPPIGTDKRYWVTGRSYYVGYKPVNPSQPRGEQKVYEEWRPFRYAAPVPYAPGFTLREEKGLDRGTRPMQLARNRELAELKTALGGQTTFHTVNDYLQAVSKLPNANFKFQYFSQYAWWELPIPKWTLPPLAGFLMIGVAWPLTLGMLGVQQKAPLKVIPIKPEPLPPSPVRPAIPAVAVAAPAPKPPPPIDSREYTGEFYPVVKVTHKE